MNSRCHPHKGVHIVTSVKDLPPTYDAFIPARHYLKINALSLVEKTALPDITNLYVTYYEGEQLTAVAYFQMLEIKNKHLVTTGLELWKKIGWPMILKLFRPKLLVAGHLFHHEITTFYCGHKEPYEAYRIYSEMMDACLHYTRATVLLVKDMPSRIVSHFQALRPQYRRMRGDISMEMTIQPHWHQLEDYVADLKHKYAQKFRKVRQSMQGLHVAEMTENDVRHWKSTIYSLYFQVAKNQQVRLGFLSEDYLPGLKAAFPDIFHVWGYFENDQLIGFYSAWTTGQVFDMYYIGIDYEKNQQYSLYFNMLYLAIELAIDLNKNKIYLGRTALEAKARLGCKPKYLSTFLYFRNPLIRQWVDALTPETAAEVWENRHPFK